MRDTGHDEYYPPESPDKPRPDNICLKCGSGLEEWVCIQEGGRFGIHTLRCFACGHEEKVKDDAH